MRGLQHKGRKEGRKEGERERYSSRARDRESERREGWRDRICMCLHRCAAVDTLACVFMETDLVGWADAWQSAPVEIESPRLAQTALSSSGIHKAGIRSLSSWGTVDPRVPGVFMLLHGTTLETGLLPARPTN